MTAHTDARAEELAAVLGSPAGEAELHKDLALGSYLRNVTARELMTAGVLTIVEDTSLRQACRAMSMNGKHAVLVVGREHGKPLGWVTSRGLLAWVESDLGLISARDAITERPVTIEPGASAREAWLALSQTGVSHLLVATNPEVPPQGVISDLDLMRLAGK